MSEGLEGIKAISAALDKLPEEYKRLSFSAMLELIPKQKARIAELEGQLDAIGKIAGSAPEINMRNYDEEEVSAINDCMNEIYNTINPKDK